MEQIRLAMDGMTDAVGELANNATDLAGVIISAISSIRTAVFLLPSLS